ncbi:MAG: hypothetical protein ACREN5_08685 [Gemmatimonadales bacterium]
MPVRSEVVFPRGALLMGVEAQTDFERRGKFDDDQARDKDTGERVWVVTVVDLEEPEESARFRKSTELKVRIVAAHRPVGPVSRVAGYPPLVAFEGLTLTPWLDQSRCHPGEGKKCRAKLAFSLRASGLVEFLDDAAEAGRDG